MNTNIYETIILGGGPAGVAAGVYADRKKIKTALITADFGGQATVASQIENIPGHRFAISGSQMAAGFKNQIEKSGIDLILDQVLKVEKEGEIFKIITQEKGEFLTKTVLFSLGRKHRDLNVLGEEKFKGKGIAYCSTCDAPFFKDKEVAIIGGGNTAFNSAMDLFPYASHIYLLIRSEKIKADATLAEEAKKNPKISIIFNAQATEIFGNILVEGLKYNDLTINKTKELAVSGVFINVGMSPKSEPIKDLVELDEMGQVKVFSVRGDTSQKGIWAAGDITNLPFKQILTASGDGIRAILDIYNHLRGLNID